MATKQVFHVTMTTDVFTLFDKYIECNNYSELVRYLEEQYVDVVHYLRKQTGSPPIEILRNHVRIDLDEKTIRIIDGELMDLEIKEISLVRL